MPPNSGAGLNRHDLYLLSPGSPASCHHTFAMQLSTGARVYGHVRRYLPPNAAAGGGGRYDVGRRGIRAAVILTRGSGGERFYAAVLKTVEAIGNQDGALACRPELKPRPDPQQTFLHGVYRNHRALCAKYASAQEEMANRPNVITMSALEFGNRPYSLPVDTFKLLVPTALLHAHSETDALSTTSSQLLPLLRCVGVSNVLRLLSALLCERRVVLTSRSPARLTGCARGALSMLAQGVLAWQHIYVPVIPPGMMTYLAAPMPYLVGVLASHAPAISRVQGLGEVLVFNLDTNEMECINVSNPQSFIPDLLRPAIQPDYGQPYVSLAEILGQDLAECLKADKGSGYGPTNVQDKVGAAASIAAGKANNLLKGAMKRMKKQSSRMGADNSQRSFESQRSAASSSHHPSMGDVAEQAMEKNGIGGGPSSRDGSAHSGGGVDASGQQQQNGGANGGPVVPPETNYTFGEGYENEASEEEARVAFTSFFLCILGDMRWYLTQPGPGQPPVLDKDKFVAERRRAGDAEGTPMYPLLSTFVQTQIFEQFANARVEEVRARRAVAKDAPLFLLASNYHRVQRMDFSHLNVRRVVRQVAQTENPSQYLIDWNVSIRRKAMALTSNSRNEPAIPQALAQICSECNECGFILMDVMAVIWERIRDSRATQWKHGLFALQLLRELLLHGPLTVVTEAEDGIDKIRGLKSYDFALRAQNSAQIRQLASQVYNMIVDRAKLFTQRRAAASSRRRSQLPRPRPPPKDARLRVTMRLADIHNLVRPGFIAGSARVAPAPPPDQGQVAVGHMAQQPAAAPAPSAYSTDLLSLGAAPAPQPSRRDTFAPQTSTDELADIFSAASVTPAAAAPMAPVPAPVPVPVPAPAAPVSAAHPSPAPSTMPPTHGAAAPPAMQPMAGSGPPPAPAAQPQMSQPLQYQPQQQQMSGYAQQQMPGYAQAKNQAVPQYAPSTAPSTGAMQQTAYLSAPAMQGRQPQQPPMMQGYGQQPPQSSGQGMVGYQIPQNQQHASNYGQQQQQHPGMFQQQQAPPQMQQQYPGAMPSQPQPAQKPNLNNLAQFDPFK